MERRAKVVTKEVVLMTSNSWQGGVGVPGGPEAFCEQCQSLPWHGEPF